MSGTAFGPALISSRRRSSSQCVSLFIIETLFFTSLKNKDKYIAIMDAFLFLALGAALGSVVDAGGGKDATARRLRAGGDGDDDDEKKQPALPDLRPSHTPTTTSSQPLPRQRAQVSEQELIDDIMRELEQETKQEW